MKKEVEVQKCNRPENPLGNLRAVPRSTLYELLAACYYDLIDADRIIESLRNKLYAEAPMEYKLNLAAVREISVVQNRNRLPIHERSFRETSSEPIRYTFPNDSK